MGFGYRATIIKISKYNVKKLQRVCTRDHYVNNIKSFLNQKNGNA